jgi:sulfite reductase alpha subunit-like flavoprotein
VSRLVVAYSRPPDAAALAPGEYAGYVQAALVAHGDALDAEVLLHPRAHVFVCGYVAPPPPREAHCVTQTETRGR